MKDFHTWNKKKIKIDAYKWHKHPKEREIWWCSIGMNVGTEIYGKGDAYVRPVIVLNSELGESFIGIPLTSKIKNGKYCCIVRVTDNKISTALISQIRNFDKRRLIKKISDLSEDDYCKVMQCISRMYKI